MDQTPKSSTIDQAGRIDQNNNNRSKGKSKCPCTNISIMQLFHEMKQEFPKVPDHIVQQLATDHCHNRRACIDQLRQATTAATPTNTMYPSKSIHNNQTPRSPLPAAKFLNNHKMREISEKFENTSSTSSSQSDSAASASVSTSSDGKISRPTTLKLRRAPDPPMVISKTATATSTTSSNSSTPNSITSLSKVNSVSSSASSLVSSGISSCQPSNTTTALEQPPLSSHQQIHHNVRLDSSATKYSDSLKVQLDVTVSPVSHPPPLPPRPSAKTARHLSQLSMQPKPAFTKLLEEKTSNDGGACVSTGSMGQRSYTSVNFTLRQPTSILPSPITPIDIQAGPSSLTYSSSSFDAKQGYQSHLKITVAGNGESCIQAVRTKQPAGSLPEISQIDTTISVGSDMTTDCEPIKIITNNQQKLPPSLISDRLMTDEELRRLIQKQLKQKELLENEFSREQEKLEMIRFDIITLSAPMIPSCELHQLCDEIFRLRIACEKLADDLDIATEPPRSPRSPASLNSPQPRRPPPPIPAALQCLSRQQSPYHSSIPLTLPPFDHSPSRPSAIQPPSYYQVMRESGRAEVVHNANSLPNLADDANDECSYWPCSMCTFLNYPLLNQCEQCEMPRVQGIKITHSSFRPMRENNQYQGSSANINNSSSTESLNVAAVSSPSPNSPNTINASRGGDQNNSSNIIAQTATAL